MGLIMVKKEGVDAEYFKKIIKESVKIINNADFGIVVVKIGSCLIANRQNLSGYQKELPGVSYIRDDDICVVTLVHGKEDDDNIIDRGIPALFEYGYTGAIFSYTGDMFISTGQRHNYYYKDNLPRSFNEYLNTVVDNPEFLKKMLTGNWRDLIINAAIPISYATKAVYGNVDGIYINSEHNFFTNKSILFSIPFLGRKIVKSLEDSKKSPKVYDNRPKKISSPYRSPYFKEKRDIMSNIRNIYFVKKYLAGHDMRNREKFVCINIKDGEYTEIFELLSLKTGELQEVKYYDINNIYKAYLIKRLHNGRSD